MNRHLLLLTLIILISACTPKKELAKTIPQTDGELRLAKAKMLSKKYIITDGHVDLPYRLKVINFRFTKELIGIPIKTEEGDFDYVRSVEGGLDAPFMSIYLPARLQKEPGESKLLADSLIDMVTRIAKTHPDNFEIAYWASDVERIFKAKKIALPMGMENGSGLEDDLSNVAYFKKRGISYITLTHSKDNLICDSSYDDTRTWNGLSPYGREVVKEMNKEGIMVDISHVSDSTFYDVLINFGSTFLDKRLQDERSARRDKRRAMLEEAGLKGDDEAAKSLLEKFDQENPPSFSDVKMVANHIDHVVKLAGIDHVGFGSDFDGVGDSLPTGLKDVSQYPNLLAELLKRGYSDEDIEKVCFGNLARVWKAVEGAMEK